MATVVDAIFVTLGLDTSKYTTQAENAIKTDERLEKSLDKVEKKGTDVSKNFDGLSKAVKSATRVLASLAAATGIIRFLQSVAEETRQANEEMLKLQASLGLTAEKINGMRGAGAALGGTAEGMTNSMKGLNKGMNDFVTKGDTGLLPFMNHLGVAMVDGQGKLRDVDKVMLDLSDSFSRMNSEQAYALGQDMGFDEGTIAALMQGRDAMKEMSEYHAKMYTSSKEELAASRELSKNQAQLSAHWQSMKLMIGNAIIPLLVKLTNFAKAFFEFLQDHQKTVKNVFEAMAFVLGAVLIPLFGKALFAALAFMAPFLPFIAIIGGLAAAFILLYDDYKVWAEGGDSLFNWGAFRDYIDNAKLSTDNLRDAFKNLTKDMLGDTIPTLKGYADIVKALASGNFKEAGAIASGMLGNFSDRVTGYIDTATGQEAGTMSNKIGETIDNILKGGGVGGIPSSKKGGFDNILSNAARKAGITDKKELAAFTAIVGHETGDGKNLSENANYSYKGWKRIAPNQRNVRNWLARHSESDFKKLSKEDKLNIMYEGMNGNRKGEGYKFRGRGAIQLTGRANYQAFADSIGRQDIMSNPDLVASDPELAAASAAWFWKNNKSIGAKARAGDIAGARKIVNGGSIGMSDVLSRYNNAINQGASQAQGMVKQSGVPSKVYTSKGAQSDMQSRSVDVKMGDLNIYTTASSVSGITSDAMRGVEASLNNLGTSMD